MDAVRPRLRWKQQNLHFAGKAKTPGIPAIRKICISLSACVLLRQKFSKKVFSKLRKRCTKVQKTNPTKFVTFVGLKRMLIRMAGIAFFRVAWYNFDKNM